MMQYFDEEGFLINPEQWSQAIASDIAQAQNIILTPQHWEIILLARKYHEKYDSSPMNKALVHYTSKELGKDKGNSIYLMQLFTAHPAKIVAKIAGLPKPHNCL